MNNILLVNHTEIHSIVARHFNKPFVYIESSVSYDKIGSLTNDSFFMDYLSKIASKFNLTNDMLFNSIVNGGYVFFDTNDEAIGLYNEMFNVEENYGYAVSAHDSTGRWLNI